MLQILQRLKSWWSPESPVRSGSRRLKNYSAETGYQYQYCLLDSQPGDYQFAIWTTATARQIIRILVPLAKLSARDRYALAKLRLFRAFDEHSPGNLPVALEVTDTAALDAL